MKVWNLRASIKNENKWNKFATPFLSFAGLEQGVSKKKKKILWSIPLSESKEA